MPKWGHPWRMENLVADVNSAPDVDIIVGIIEGWSIGLIASVFNHSNLHVAKAASILESGNLSVSRAASILSHANITADRVQAILYQMVEDGHVRRLIEILTDGASDLNVAADTTLTDGVSRFNKLSVAAGVTLSLATAPAVVIAREIDNGGVIAPTWIKATGGASASGSGAGANGKGGAIILGADFTIGTISGDGIAGGNGGASTAYTSGNAGSGGLLWLDAADSTPNSGKGGEAGPAGYEIPGGEGGTPTVQTFSNATDIAKEILKAACDWWVQNIISKTPTAVKTLPELGASGGGSGGARGTGETGGGGGSHGAPLIAIGDNVIAGTFNSNGGAGGAGYSTDGDGGDGGDGGIVYLFYKSLTGTPTFNVAGGAGGTGTTAGVAGAAGVGRAIQLW